MSVNDFNQQDIEGWLDVLGETCRLLAKIESRLDVDGLHIPAERGEWSPNQVLAHLRACQDIWGYSIYAMLSTEAPILASPHPRDWVKAKNYSGVSFQESSNIFQLDRADLLRVLERLSREDWARFSTIKGRKHTIFSQVRRMAKHEQEHMGQLGAFLA